MHLLLNLEGLFCRKLPKGIGIEKDILQYMAFTPIIDSPRPMEPCIFDEMPMDLKAILIAPTLEERINWDAERDLLFIDFENYSVRDKADVDAIRLCVEHEVVQKSRKASQCGR